MNIANLAGVPSIIYGLLGLGIFVRVLGFGRSLLAGSLTMALLVLPIIIINAREALRAVPPSQREAAYALGATRSQVTMRVVLPAALPGIMTGVILALSRAIGETAPLITIGALTFIAFLPEGPLDAVYGAADPDLQLGVATAGWLSRHRRLGDHRPPGVVTEHECACSVAARSRSTRKRPDGERRHPGARPESLVRRLQSHRRRQHSLSGKAGHGHHWAVWMRQEHCLALHQSHERAHPRRPRRRRRPFPWRERVCAQSRCGRGAPPHRDGVSEAESVPQIDLRQYRLWSTDQRLQRRPERARAALARASSAMGRGQGPLEAQRPQPVGRSTATPVHRARHRHRARGHPDGRAVLRARPHRHLPHRRADG